MFIPVCIMHHVCMYHVCMYVSCHEQQIHTYLILEPHSKSAVLLLEMEGNHFIFPLWNSS